MTSRDEPTSLADEMSRQERSRRVVIVLFMMGLSFWDTLNPFFYDDEYLSSSQFFVMSLTFLVYFESVFYDEPNLWGYFESVLRAGQTRFAEELSRGHEHTS